MEFTTEAISAILNSLLGFSLSDAIDIDIEIASVASQWEIDTDWIPYILDSVASDRDIVLPYLTEFSLPAKLNVDEDYTVKLDGVDLSSSSYQILYSGNIFRWKTCGNYENQILTINGKWGVVSNYPPNVASALAQKTIANILLKSGYVSGDVNKLKQDTVEISFDTAGVKSKYDRYNEIYNDIVDQYRRLF